ncbi:MAG: hypothetical protein KDD25_04080, partial [Bdellovibrionales bacterium]|nr:hypothetical protein [Bdellovibrionales bacterium]
WPLEKVLSSTPDQISEAFGGEQSIQNQIQNFGKDEQTNYALRMASRGTQILADGAEYYDDDMSLNSTNLTESGVAYQSTVVKLLIQAACGKRIEELQHDIGWRNGFWVMLGSLRFTAPRLVKSDQNVCHSIAYTPYKSFWVTENGKDVHYYNILDYVLRNIPDDLTVEKFDSEWWPHVLSYSEEVYKGYKEKEKTAFDEQIEKAFYDPSYGRFLKLDDMTKVGNPLTGASFLHPILTSTSDPFIRRKMYANGIRQFAVDTSDYLIRVIVSMLPHEDPEFTDRVYYILENIQELTRNVGTDFESLLQNSTWKQYANHIIQSELDSIDNEKEYVAAGLQFAMYRTPDYHRLALHHRIDELKFAIKNEFQRRNASNTYTRAITRALDLILDQVEAQVGHASMLQTMTPRSFKVPVSSQPEKSRPIDPSNIEVILGPGQIEPKDTDTITNKNFENEIEIIQGENQ